MCFLQGNPSHPRLRFFQDYFLPIYHFFRFSFSSFRHIFPPPQFFKIYNTSIFPRKSRWYFPVFYKPGPSPSCCYLSGRSPSIRIHPSGKAFRNRQRTSGPAIKSWKGSAMTKFFGMLASQLRSTPLHCPALTQASAAP